MAYRLTRSLLLAVLICGHGAFAAEGQSSVAKAVKGGESSVRVKGPSKEQTIQFINNVLSGLEGETAYSDSNEIFYEFIHGSVDENCSVHLKIQRGKGDGTNRFSEDSKFNLRDIERVSAPIKNGWGIFVVEFHTSQGQKLILSTGLTDTAKNYAHIPTADKKLAKAFDHLRKLCGAPEPMEF